MIRYSNALILILCLFFKLEFIYSQERSIETYTKELNIKFNSLDNKRFEKGIRLLIDADRKFEDAKSVYSSLDTNDKINGISDDYMKSFKLLIEASDLFNEGNLEIYRIYKSKCEIWWSGMKKTQQYASGVEKGRYYERQVQKHLEHANQRRIIAGISEKYDYALVKVNEANELEELAIRDQGRALQVYIDYPVEYNYGWVDDVTLTELIEMFKNPAVNEPPVDIFATVYSDSRVDPSVFKDILFKVQIAAHTVPLTEEYLRTIYKGTMRIDMIYEEGWYKYSIGIYKDFDDANKTLEECNVRKAFIVAYEEGKKLTVKEAFDKLELKQKNNQ